MLNVKINGELFTANTGEKLSDVLIKKGFAVEHPCGGRGTCKKCLVKVNGKDELSCQYVLESDIEVEIDESLGIVSESGVDESSNRTDNLCLALRPPSVSVIYDLSIHDKCDESMENI